MNKSYKIIDKCCNTCNSLYNRTITNCINCMFPNNNNWQQVIDNGSCDCCGHQTKNLKYIVKMGIRGWYCIECIKKVDKYENSKRRRNI